MKAKEKGKNREQSVKAKKEQQNNKKRMLYWSTEKIKCKYGWRKKLHEKGIQVRINKTKK
jgi:hypothetical protein